MNLGDLRRRLSRTMRLLEQYDRRLAAAHKDLKEFRHEEALNAKALLAAYGRTQDLLEKMGGEGLDPALAAELEELIRRRAEDLVPVDQPLVLISQVQRSGGTLLSQLFDGHPGVHAHPHELHLSWPRGKYAWPQLDLEAGPELWFETLREPATHKFFAEGYTKPGVETLDRLPFLLPPTLQRRLFMAAVAARRIESARDVLNAYMTSYFNAWLDNQNLYGEKRWVTAFAARTTIETDNRDAFFADYPDGRLIGIVREPVSWYASAVRYMPERYARVDRAVELWRQSALSLLEAREAYGAERVRLVNFERLVSDTRATMAELTDWLGIDLPPIATVPTFNTRPIRANSSFDVAGHGVLEEAAHRDDALPNDQRETILQLAGDVHERALGAVTAR